MSEEPLQDLVAQQYELWQYPEPILDLPSWLADNWQWFDPSHAHHMLWPERAFKAKLDILVAGCGTNQAAVLAYTNPGARVVGIDVSQPSLDHQSFLKEKYGLDNLELHLLPIEDVAHLNREFDLIISTGVLHHLADPQRGMNALAKILRPDGVVALMLYAQYGRIGVEMMQSIFRDLGLKQDHESVVQVQHALQVLPSEHPVKSYLTTAPDITFDAGLVDTFLHGRDRSFTVNDCLTLVDQAGLQFQDWFLKSAYEPIPEADNPFLSHVAALPNAERWSVMERMNTTNACHFFTARHGSLSRSMFHVDLTQDKALHYIPHFRYRCGLQDHQLVRPGWSTPITAAARSVLEEIDGERSIRQVIDAAFARNTTLPQSLEQTQEFALSLLRTLWNRDFISFEVPQI